jgi:4'-phosphopantetheinyl transferase
MRETTRVDEANDHCDVWVFSPSAALESTGLDAFIAVLSEVERLRMDRFHQAQDRITFAVSHGFTRMALTSRAPDIAPSAWVFRSDSSGRPEIETVGPAAPLRFSLSHTRGLVACAVVPSASCGIDVEFCRESADFSDLFGWVLNAYEVATMEGLPKRERKARFLQYWTLKEAYAKALGIGMSSPFNLHAFDLDPPTLRAAALRATEYRGGQWQFEQWWVGKSHVVALAMCRADGPAPAVILHNEISVRR